MKIFKRMGALLAALTIVASCMVPATFADEKKYFSYGEGASGDGKLTSDINDVDVGVTKIQKTLTK